MNDIHKPKPCIRGERCKNPYKDANGNLPPDQFSDGDTVDELRGDCKVCHLYFDTTPQGTMDEWLYRNGGVYVEPTGRMQSNTRCFTTLEVAILWGISASAIRKFKDPNKTDVPLQPLQERGKRNTLLFSERSVKGYAKQFASKIEQERRIGENRHDEYLADLEKARQQMLQRSLDMPARQDAQDSQHQETISNPIVATPSEGDECLADLVAYIKAFFAPIAFGAGSDINDYINAFASQALAKAIIRAEQYLSNSNRVNDGYPPPTFTPPAYDDLGEIADDNHIYMSAGRGEPPQFQRVKLFGGNGTKED